MLGDQAPADNPAATVFPHHVHGDVEEVFLICLKSTERLHTLHGMLEFWKACNNMGKQDLVDKVFPGEAPNIRRHLIHSLEECRHDIAAFMGRLDQQKQLQLLVFIYDTYDSGGTPEKLQEALEAEGMDL